MRQLFPRRVDQGDSISAHEWNYKSELIAKNSLEVDASSGLSMMQSPGGTAISITGDAGYVWAGIVGSGGITARSSATAGTGPVDLQILGDLGVYTDAGQTVTVYSISSTAGGVPEGAYVEVAPDVNGNWHLLSVDCT